MARIGNKAGYLPFLGLLSKPLDCIIAGLRSYDSLRIENHTKGASAVVQIVLWWLKIDKIEQNSYIRRSASKLGNFLFKEGVK